MQTCLVSLVGDQTIPNILVALHFQPQFLLLISTLKMERKNKSQAFLNTLKLRGFNYTTKHCIVQVQEDSINDLQSQVSHWLEESPEDYQFIVNLTGGTKIMSIAAYDLFNDFGSTMVYVPIHKNEYLIPFPKRRPKQPVPLTERLTVAEYLTSYGVIIENIQDLPAYLKSTMDRRETTRFMYQHYEEIKPLLHWFGEHLRPLKPKVVKKGYNFCQTFSGANEPQLRLLADLGFQKDGDTISKRIQESEWNYLRGGWLEERLFLAVQESLVGITDVQLGLKVKDAHGNPNEFDVLFTCENVLYLIECKSLEAGQGNASGEGGTVTSFLYKQGTLRQQFGLTPKSFLATTSSSIYDTGGQVKDHLVKRAQQSNSEIIPLLQVPDLESYLQRKIVCPL